MSKTGKSRSGRRKGGVKRVFFLFALLIFGTYAAYSFVTLQFEISQKQKELEEVKSRHHEQRLANAELARLLDEGRDDEYIEEKAREKLGYAYPDELFIIDVSGD